jgi:hypothetical protein
MNSISAARRAAVLLTTLAVVGAGLLAAPAGAQAPAEHPGADARRAPATTTLTFAVPDCKRYRITLHQDIVHR